MSALGFPGLELGLGLLALDLALIHHRLSLGQLLTLGLECLMQLIEILLIGLQFCKLTELAPELPPLHHNLPQLLPKQILHFLLTPATILLKLPQSHL